jgi:hypothetical protein
LSCTTYNHNLAAAKQLQLTTKKYAIILFLYKIKAYFKVGSFNIRRSNVPMCQCATKLYIASIKVLMEVIIPLFSKYPLLPLLFFKSVVELINTNKHLTIEGLIEIFSIRVASNLGLTDTLIASFPNITPKARARAIKYENINIPSSYLYLFT